MALARVPLAPSGGMADTPQAPRLPGIAGELTNWYYRAGSYVRRLSAKVLHQERYPVKLAGVWAFKQASGAVAPTYYLMAATRGTPGAYVPQVLRLVGSTLFPVPMLTTETPKAGANDYWREWRTAMVSNSRGFICRLFESGFLIHVEMGRATNAGITAPTACTVTNAATGSSHPGGDYAACCYTFVTDDGAESSRSPLSATATLAAGDSRRWTLQTSRHPRVTKRRLYVPVAGPTNTTPYFAIDVNDNTTVTYDEATLDSALSNLIAPTRNGVPPSHPEDCCIFDERLFVVSNDPSPGVWYSEIDQLGPQWEAFSSARVLRIPPRGGRRFTAVRAWDRERLLIFTESSTHVVRISGVGYDIEDLNSTYGCLNASCAAVGQGGVALWFDGRQVIRCDGGAAQVCSRGWVDRVLSKIPPGYAERSSLFFVPEEGVFMLSVPSTASSTEPDMVLAYDPLGGGGAGEWHRAGWFWTGTDHKAPTAWGYVPLSAELRDGYASPEWSTVCCFPHDERLVWLCSQDDRDEGLVGSTSGPVAVRTVVLSPPIAAEGGKQLAVSRIAVGVGPRRDSRNENESGTVIFVGRLLLDSYRASASVTFNSRDSRIGRYLYPRLNNLGDLAAFVQIELTSDLEYLAELFDLQAEIVTFDRGAQRG